MPPGATKHVKIKAYHDILIADQHGEASQCRMQATTILARDPKLARRGITTIAVCPGSCNTDMNPLSSGGTAADGGAAILFAVQHPDPKFLNGRFFMRGREVPM